MNECLIQERIFPRYPERMGEEMTRPSVCYSSTFTYIYLSTTVLESRATLWHLTLVCIVLSFPAWDHHCPHFGSQSCSHFHAFNFSLHAVNLSISWYNMCLYFMMYSISVTSLSHSIPHTHTVAYMTSEILSLWSSLQTNKHFN